jgi:hypothetical protein
MTEVKFDLSRISVSTGTHKVTVKARGIGYGDSVDSISVDYCDTTTISGTWLFNTVQQAPDIWSDDLVQEVTFVGNLYYKDAPNWRQVSCRALNLNVTGDISFSYLDSNGLSTSSRVYYPSSGWNHGVPRTVTFDGVQTVSKEFYDWFTANATQTHCLLHAGTYVWNDRPSDSYYHVTGEFVSNDEIFVEAHNDIDDLNILKYYKADGSSIEVYGDNSRTWANTAYKTMVFTTNALVEKDAFDTFMRDVTFVAGDTVQVSGTWLFYTPFRSETIEPQKVKFTSNGVDFTGIGVNEVNALSFYTGFESNNRNVVTSGAGIFYESNSRTITFDGVQTVSKEFYDWFTANAVQQTIGFTIDGTQYFAEPGMTWAEWVASSYNTDGWRVVYDFVTKDVDNITYYVYDGNFNVNPQSNIIEKYAYGTNKEPSNPGGKE